MPGALAGTRSGVQVLRDRAIRRGKLTRSQQVEALRRRTGGLTPAKAHKLARTGKLHGVPKHPVPEQARA